MPEMLINSSNLIFQHATTFVTTLMHPSLFHYSGQILNIEVVDGGMICSSGVCLEAMGDKNDDCYIVNAAVYVGY